MLTHITYYVFIILNHTYYIVSSKFWSAKESSKFSTFLLWLSKSTISSIKETFFKMLPSKEHFLMMFCDRNMGKPTNVWAILIYLWLTNEIIHPSNNRKIKPAITSQGWIGILVMTGYPVFQKQFKGYTCNNANAFTTHSNLWTMPLIHQWVKQIMWITILLKIQWPAWNEAHLKIFRHGKVTEYFVSWNYPRPGISHVIFIHCKAAAAHYMKQYVNICRLGSFMKKWGILPKYSHTSLAVNCRKMCDHSISKLYKNWCYSLEYIILK